MSDTNRSRISRMPAHACGQAQERWLAYRCGMDKAKLRRVWSANQLTDKASFSLTAWDRHSPGREKRGHARRRHSLRPRIRLKAQDPHSAERISAPAAKARACPRARESDHRRLRYPRFRWWVLQLLP